jgi:pimeloyl-ACP methyl ester carboxylesterase
VRSGSAAAETLPGMMRWSNEAAWRDWGIGPEPGLSFEDTKFPYEHLDQLLASYTTVISSGRSGAGSSQRGKESGGGEKGDRFGSAVKTRALAALLEQIGPAILVVHSAAGAVGIEILQRRPDLVKALIMIEPIGCPTDAAEVKALFADAPTLAVFGDHFDVRRMQGRYEACMETMRLIEEAGGRSKMLHLPSLGISGNTHLLMQDKNSHEIAARVIDWLQNNQLD